MNDSLSASSAGPSASEETEPGERGSEQGATGRVTCYRCFRPVAHCYCADIPLVENATPVVIIQHPRERFHPIGTARIASLGLKNSTVLVNSDRRYSREPIPLPQGAGLLFPDPEARDLADLPASDRPAALVVLDGTWHHAHTLFRDIPGLESLPRFRFTPPRPSQYRLRREPQRDYVSTVEAIVYALQALEPQTTHLDGLLSAFHKMIDRQATAQTTQRVGRVRKQRRTQGVSRLPRAFAEDYRRTVLAYGESFRVRDATGHGRRHLVHWVAKRVSDGATFDVVLREGAKAARPMLPMMDLGDDDVAGSVSADEFRSAWRAFLRPDDILVGWNQSTLALLETHALWSGDRIFLKAAYHSVRPRQGGGAPEDLVRQEGLPPHANGLRGRGGRRLANAETLCTFLAGLAND